MIWNQHAASARSQSADIASLDAMPQPPLCSVRLIDRRTGKAPRVNGAPLLVYSRNPESAAAEMLDGRDPDLWEIRIEPLTTQRRQ